MYIIYTDIQTLSIKVGVYIYIYIYIIILFLFTSAGGSGLIVYAFHFLFVLQRARNEPGRRAQPLLTFAFDVYVGLRIWNTTVDKYDINHLMFNMLLFNTILLSYCNILNPCKEIRGTLRLYNDKPERRRPSNKIIRHTKQRE